MNAIFGDATKSEYHARKRSYLGVEVPIVDFVHAPFQVEDLAKLAEMDNSCNFSEMGCYKTSTVLWLIQQKLGTDLSDKHILIVTTKTGKIPYYNMTPSILRDVPVYNLDAKGAKEHDFTKPGVYLSHYHVFADARKKDRPEDLRPYVRHPSPATAKFLDVEWDMVVLDEGHRIKDTKTKWVHWLKKLTTTYKHIMTGNGFINKPDEIWSLLNFIRPDEFRSYWRFRDNWCLIDTDFYGYSHVVGVRNVTAFRAMTKKYGVRRTKAEVFKDLPERYVTRIPVELSPRQRQMYDSIEGQMYTLDIKGQMLPTPAVLSQLTRLRQIAVASPIILSDEYSEKEARRIIKVGLREPSSKLDAMMEIIEGSDEKIVVFSQFVDGIELSKARLDKTNISYIHMAQRDNEAVRMSKVAEFQEGNTRIFLSTLALGSEAITLTAASTVIFLDRSWSPKDNEQAIARVHRPGQTLPTQIIMIEANNTVDQRLEERLREKYHWFDAIFN